MLLLGISRLAIWLIYSEETLATFEGSVEAGWRNCPVTAPEYIINTIITHRNCYYIVESGLAHHYYEDIHPSLVVAPHCSPMKLMHAGSGTNSPE